MIEISTACLPFLAPRQNPIRKAKCGSNFPVIEMSSL